MIEAKLFQDRYRLFPNINHMKPLLIIAAAFVVFTSAGFGEPVATTGEAEVKYTKAIEGRAADILKILALSDTNAAARVQSVIVEQYRSLRVWHDENDPKLKAAKGDTNATATIKASLQTIHDGFISRLGETLNPEQVEAVKDKMTYGKVQFTYKGYLLEYPDMNDAQKAEVLRLLKVAREEAMDGGSSDEKSAIFNRYKGKINNYLSKQGIEPLRKKKPAGTAGSNAPAIK